MSVSLYLQTDPTLVINPYPLTTSDSKRFQAFQELLERPTWRAPDGTRTTLARAVGLDLSPLTAVANGADVPLGEYLAWFPDTVTGRAAAQAAYERQCARDAAAWQPPHVLIECLRRLIAAVDRHPEVIADIADGLWHADRRYFADGHWRADLATMLRCLE